MYISSLSQGKTTINNLGYVMFSWSFLATAAWKTVGLLSPLFSHIFQWPLVTATTELVHSAGNLHTDNLWKFLERSSYFVCEFKEISYTASQLLHPPSIMVLNCRRNGSSQIHQILNILSFLSAYPPVTAKNSTLKKIHIRQWTVTEKWMQQRERITVISQL